eukprot:712672-Amphidinium_carterae.1
MRPIATCSEGNAGMHSGSHRVSVQAGTASSGAGVTARPIRSYQMRQAEPVSAFDTAPGDQLVCSSNAYPT